MHASELFAKAHGCRCEGMEECHWCSAPCDRKWYHDDKPIVAFTKVQSNARRYGNAFICAGCWLWRRRSVTVFFLSTLDGEKRLRDRQNMSNLSLWIGDEGVHGVEKLDHPALWKRLLHPPCRFALGLLSPGGGLNQLHLMLANDNAIVKADTPLHFTINNVPHAYTTYELEQATRSRSAVGKEPGVRALVGFLGMPEPPPALQVKKTDKEMEEAASGEAKKGRGRPTVEERNNATDVGRTLRKSG